MKAFKFIWYGIILGAVFGGHMAHASIADRAYFFSYLSKSFVSNPSYKQEKPFVIPSTLPEPAELADSMASKINPDTFLRGASTSEHQCSKRCTPEACSWSRFAKEHNLPQPTDAQYPMDLWKHYRSYIDYAKDEMKLNALRFSVEWALVQPKDYTEWDQEALDHYADMFVYAIKKGITPLVCFHHYTDPCWFVDRGGFTKDENVKLFVNFCNKVYSAIMQAIKNDQDACRALREMQPRKPLWATYNAPEGYAFKGYHQKQGPPADPKQSNLRTVAQVLKNMLEAHVQMYYALKDTYADLNLDDDGIEAPAIGFLKNIHQLDPAQQTWKQYLAKPLTKTVCTVADMIQNEAVFQFFTTGTFKVQIPFAVGVKHVNRRAVGTLDFIGLNYYSNRHLYLTNTVEPSDPDMLTDNRNYCRYPQGIYRAIVEMTQKLVEPYKKKLNRELPLYVTENGIATNDDEKRYRFYHEYLYAMNRAVQDGYKISGYLPWTFASNYEWPSLENNNHREYGICAINAEDPSKLIAKEGSRSYLAFVERMSEHSGKKRQHKVIH